MFQKIKKFLFKAPIALEDENELDVPLAAATLMMEVSWADHTISDQEIEISAKKLSEIFSLDDHPANALLEEGKILMHESVGLQQFTTLLNENLAADQKFSIVLALWEVAREGNSIDALEEHQIRNISELLYVPHSKFIEAKLSSRKPQTQREIRLLTAKKGQRIERRKPKLSQRRSAQSETERAAGRIMPTVVTRESR